MWFVMRWMLPADDFVIASFKGSEARMVPATPPSQTPPAFVENSRPPKKHKISAMLVSENLPGRVFFVEPTDNDVLLGRGGRTNNHPGNKRYLVVKDCMQARYMAANMDAKMLISLVSYATGPAASLLFLVLKISYLTRPVCWYFDFFRTW